MIERINKAVADCLILCAYSRKPIRETANEFAYSLYRDPLWDQADASRVMELVRSVIERLEREPSDREGWVDIKSLPPS
jgi:hypothetical protein